MAERPGFQERQYAFAAHIRDPQGVPAPEGIEDRRMAIYRELFFNNLKSLLTNMFPVLTKLHSDQHWRRLVRKFMQRHQAKTPYFLQLPAEFLDFLQNEYEPGPDCCCCIWARRERRSRSFRMPDTHGIYQHLFLWF